MNADLEARDLRFAYQDRMILDGVDFSLQAGEVVALLGPNGAGKSTLLRLLLGFLKPAGGEILLQGRPIGSYGRKQLAQRLAYVPQSHAGPFPYSVREVVTMGRLARRGLFLPPSRADRDIVDHWLERLAIGHLAERVYTEISGGERQLVLLARALVQEAMVLVLDEPASALDFGHQIRFLRQVRRLAAEGYGVIMTTHHPDHAMAAASRVVLLRDGRVLADGAPQSLLTFDAIGELYGLTGELSAAKDAPGAVLSAALSRMLDDDPCPARMSKRT